MMDVPPDIATRRGSDMLGLLATFCDNWAGWYRFDEPDLLRSDAFMALADMCRAVKLSGELHVQKMAAKREKGERVWRETDETVEIAVDAARSAFIRGKTLREPPPLRGQA